MQSLKELARIQKEIKWRVEKSCIGQSCIWESRTTSVSTLGKASDYDDEPPGWQETHGSGKFKFNNIIRESKIQIKKVLSLNWVITSHC